MVHYRIKLSTVYTRFALKLHKFQQPNNLKSKSIEEATYLEKVEQKS